MSKKYKVVHPQDDKYISCFASGEWSLDYRIGETTVPKFEGSKIFVFDSLYNARGFMGSSEVILSGEAVNSKRVRRKVLSLSISDFANFWKHKKLHSILDFVTDGTFFCDSFTPDGHVFKNGTGYFIEKENK